MSRIRSDGSESIPNSVTAAQGTTEIDPARHLDR
jgi:hypothetical protein